MKQMVIIQVKTANLVARQLRADIAKLSPFKWDSEEVRRQKWQAVLYDDYQRRINWGLAVEASVTVKVSGSVDGHSDNKVRLPDNKALRSSLEMHDSLALRQAELASKGEVQRGEAYDGRKKP
ncbi:MAG: hypothetical protein DMG54_30580 [Acidobacteria bacterium]|nr:MAG: hypothetical protein DMG54_30580 [Acidobacteriota bacterium]PYU68929.1 MAG: hypothetical protein DMG52_30115 [Acidobacteriota bacterium]